MSITLILYFVLRDGPFIYFTRFNEKVIAYNLIYLGVTKSSILASKPDFVTIVVLIIVTNYFAYNWYSNKHKKVKI